MFISSQITTLLQIFCELTLCSHVISKSMREADDTFWSISECEWVNLTINQILYFALPNNERSWPPFWSQTRTGGASLGCSPLPLSTNSKSDSSLIIWPGEIPLPSLWVWGGAACDSISSEPLLSMSSPLPSPDVSTPSLSLINRLSSEPKDFFRMTSHTRDFSDLKTKWKTK